MLSVWNLPASSLHTMLSVSGGGASASRQPMPPSFVDIGSPGDSSALVAGLSSSVAAADDWGT